MAIRNVILISLLALVAKAYDGGEMLFEPTPTSHAVKISHAAEEDAVRGYLPSAAAEGRPRQQGFGSKFHDVFDYIDTITYAIWEKGDIGLVRKYYAENCTAHTLEGQTRGAEDVVKGTVKFLAAFPDRTLFPEGIAWSRYSDGRYATSHLISTKMTNRGDSPFGAATGKAARIRVIAHCVIKGDQIVNEWLVRDNYQLAVQLGKDPAQVAKEWAATEPSPEQNKWLASEYARVQAKPRGGYLTAPVEVLSKVTKLLTAWSSNGYSALNELYHPHAVFQGPSGRDLVGPSAIWSEYYHEILSTLENFTLSLDHVAANSRTVSESSAVEHGVVAVQWTIVGKHAKDGLWGSPSGAPVVILGESHWQFANGLVVQDITIFDELSVMAQIERVRMQAKGGASLLAARIPAQASGASGVLAVSLIGLLAGSGATIAALRGSSSSRQRRGSAVGVLVEPLFSHVQ
jgi:hypothetical protein